MFGMYFGRSDIRPSSSNLLFVHVHVLLFLGFMFCSSWFIEHQNAQKLCSQHFGRPLQIILWTQLVHGKQVGVLEEHSGFLKVPMITEELLCSSLLRRGFFTSSKYYLIIKILRLGGSIFPCNKDSWCQKSKWKLLLMDRSLSFPGI